jgi:hypothetical protein
MSNGTKYTLVFGYCANTSMLQSERFEGHEGRKACWARVKELCDVRHNIYGWVGRDNSTLAVLEVYATAGGKTSKTSFRPHVQGSAFIRHTDKHGQGWAPDTVRLSGVPCG